MPSKRPNFLIIVADDLGFSDLGAYGSEIKTPNLEKLAQDGIRMTNFHTAPACSPTRSMLFSGTDNHIAGLGQMAEFMGPHPEVFKDKPGYEGYLNWRVAALSEILEDSGYHTVMSGKWHLGLEKEFAPCSRGFKKNFTFLPGSGNHYGYEPQLDSSEVRVPNFLRTDGLWMEGEEFLDRKTQLPENFYSTVSFTDKLISIFKERDEAELDQPFFAYLPFTAPHWPLQAPKDIVARYSGLYDDGPTMLAQRRLKRLIELGLVPEDVEPAPPVKRGRLWDSMNDREKAESVRKMEVFAAMVDLIDQNVGRVMDYLESTGELENTFVLFMSDNGAEGVAMEALPVMGGPRTMANVIETYYDNSLENIGSKTSFVWYGSEWASSATAPSCGLKSWVLEGGIRCPCIVRVPVGSDSSNKSNTTSAVTDAFTTVMDILPTVLDLADTPHPGSRFQNRDVVHPRGVSWMPHLSSVLSGGEQSPVSSVHGEDAHIYGWELFGQRAIRKGPWKAVWLPEPRGREEWELYNVAEDPGEVHDRVQEQPEVLVNLAEEWERYFAETGMMDVPLDVIAKRS